MRQKGEKMAQNPPSLKEGIQNFSVPGFTIGATAAGLKPNGKLDLCVLISDRPSMAAAVFTRNRIVGEPVKLDRLHLKHATHRAVVVNAKYSNVCTGDEGYRNAREMASTVAELVGCEPEEVFVASTGIIGQQVPMDRALPGIRAAFEARATDGWEQAAHAIMTTDTFPKAVSRTVQINGSTVTLGGIAKGSGMIHPNMATMLCFLATDAAIEKHVLQEMLRRVADRSFNCVTVDGDTSTSDSMILLANGLAGNKVIAGPGADLRAFEQALEDICVRLARAIARDGEGAQHLITVKVSGARTDKAAHQIAETVATSPLVKTAIAGRDANWGRIAAAAGRAGVPFSASSLTLRMNGTLLFELGQPVPFDDPALTKTLAEPDVEIEIEVGEGVGKATVWTCDLTHEYISINGDYRS